MKYCSFIIFFIILIVGCDNHNGDDNLLLIESENETEKQAIQSEEIPIFYADIDKERQPNFKLLNIENQEHHLNIYKYCLNDSLIEQNIHIESEGKLIPAIQIYHNYEVDMLLFRVKNDPGTIFRKKINKEIFKDSLSEDFYQKATILHVKYHSVKSNRIYFNVALSVPDSNWQEEFMCAIFFRTDNISQLDFWKK